VNIFYVIVCIVIDVKGGGEGLVEFVEDDGLMMMMMMMMIDYNSLNFLCY
jgi:hypothetical protein